MQLRCLQLLCFQRNVESQCIWHMQGISTYNQHKSPCCTGSQTSVAIHSLQHKMDCLRLRHVQESLTRSTSTSTRLAALEQENTDMKAQIASLNARLAQHAQHAEQLLAGTEAFFGDKAGTIIGQPLEEEDSDSDMSFTSAQERSFSRPLSAGSSYSSARSRDVSARSRSTNSPFCLHLSTVALPH